MTASVRLAPSSVLTRARVPALLITTLKNILYLTNISLSSGFVLALPSGFLLFVDRRYLEVAKKNTCSEVTVCPIGDIEICLQKQKRVGVEADDVTLSRYAVLQKKFKNTKFVQVSGVIEEFRRSKQRDELQWIDRAQRITKAVLRIIPTLLRSGMTEKELAWQLEGHCRKRGADAMAFETIVAFGEHTARPHHHPTDRKLKKGDLVQIDMGAAYSGYCSDYSRVYFTGKPTKEQTKALRALKEAKAAAEAMIAVGVTNRALDRKARSILKTYGYDQEFSHALGHGLGLDIHEGPTLSQRAPNKKLVKNEVITIEPGLYFEGQWGMRIEDTCVVKDLNVKN